MSEFIAANETEKRSMIEYFQFCLRKVCDSMDMIDMALSDKELSSGQKEIKDKRIIGPARQTVGNYNKITRAIANGDIVIRAGTIKKFKKEGNDGKNINGKKPAGS